MFLPNCVLNSDCLFSFRLCILGNTDLWSASVCDVCDELLLYVCLFQRQVPLYESFYFEHVDPKESK